MFPPSTFVHLRPAIKASTKRPQSAPGSTDAEDQYYLPARQAPILLPVADSSDAQPSSSSRRLRPVQKSLSYVASESNLRSCGGEPVHEKLSRRIRKLPPLPPTSEPEPFTSTCPSTPSSHMVLHSRSSRPLPALPITVEPAKGSDPLTPPPRSASLPRFRLAQAGATPSRRLASIHVLPPEPLSPGLVFSPASPIFNPASSASSPTSPFSPVFSPASPIVPDITPEETKNKNFLKLRRFLGESLPADMVLRPNSRASSMTSSSSDGSDQLVAAPDQRLVSPRDVASFGKRISRKWVREKGGHRWVEDDYQDVLSALRKL
ncbi:hypothetical protein NEOLEDRAFT_1139135 [Neolentinus lepideus HHB14362 ss-1]|uniref:Uncharacterized protein n=1 Tax=Neolentinus lepideus HHB14362 ss-1 TaxID=1314782 RepID=A0A165PZZ9_9AGAM|nr:hypothetical protein NEOLEDRAFT_1139135 [Neolentinus lepideus HHB14362 ss-1]